MEDLQLVINQLLLDEYLEEAKSLLEHFVDVIISHISKTFIEAANDKISH